MIRRPFKWKGLHHFNICGKYMLEVNALLLLVVIFFAAVVPRFTLLLAAVFLNEEVLQVFSGSDMMVALVVGWFLFPYTAVTHFLFASIHGAPEVGSFIYMIVLIIAFFADLNWWVAKHDQLSSR